MQIFNNIIITVSKKVINTLPSTHIHVYIYYIILGLKLIVYFDIQIFFNFQANSPNILLHIKVVKPYYFRSVYDSYLTHSAYVMKANYSEILMSNIDYYV